MSTVTLATDAADARAIRAIEAHHAELSGALALRVGGVMRAAARSERVDAARQDLVRWCETELVPHALAEEEVLYPPAHDQVATRLLVTSMSGEHEILTGLVARLAAADEPTEVVAAAGALHEVFLGHVAKENDLLLPALAASPSVSLAGLLAGMHEQLEASAAAAGSEAPPTPEGETTGEGGAGHACGCTEHDDGGYPELDARAVPHAIRHATVFGALDAVAVGSGMVLVAPHDPLPLLDQLAQRHPDAFGVDYLERGPETWRILLRRVA